MRTGMLVAGLFLLVAVALVGWAASADVSSVVAAGDVAGVIAGPFEASIFVVVAVGLFHLGRWVMARWDDYIDQVRATCEAPEPILPVSSLPIPAWLQSSQNPNKYKASPEA